MRKLICLGGVAIVLAASTACSGGHSGVGETSVDAVTEFGDELSLVGYRIRPQSGHTELELKWSTLRKPNADYDVFVHAIDASGAIVFQLDHRLSNASGRPTSAWNAGEAVSDRFLASPPGDRTPGTYPLRIGVYFPKPLKFLGITRSGFARPKDGWNDHAVLIENVECR